MSGALLVLTSILTSGSQGQEFMLMGNADAIIEAPKAVQFLEDMTTEELAKAVRSHEFLFHCPRGGLTLFVAGKNPSGLG